MNNDKPFSTVKSAGPHTLFARFLHKKAAQPTPKQFNTWDDDGGQGYDPYEGYLAIVHGRICRSRFQKFMAHVSYMWRSGSRHSKQRSRYSGK